DHYSSRANHRSRGAASASCNLSLPLHGIGRRSHLIWTGANGARSASGIVCRSHLAWRAAGRVAGPNTHEIPARGQSRDGESTRAHRASHAADASRRGDRMSSRRAFIRLLGGAAVAWPLAARAQQPAMPVVGYLSARSPEDTTHLMEAFRRGLKGTGFIDGQTVTVEYRWALGQYDRLPAMAAEFARRPVAIIVATGGEPAALAAKAATSTVPIVFSIGGDPIKQGLAASFNRPGGNSTGITLLTNQLEPKRLGLLRQLVPQATTIGFLLNPSYPPSEGQLKDAEEAARAMSQQIHILRADTDDEIDAAFQTVTQQGIAALAVAAAPF